MNVYYWLVGLVAALIVCAPVSAGGPENIIVEVQGGQSDVMTDLTFNGSTSTSGPLEPGEIDPAHVCALSEITLSKRDRPLQHS